MLVTESVEGGFFSSSASGYSKKRFVHRCASFICFGRPATGPQSSAPPNVRPTIQQDILPRTPVSTEENDQTRVISTVDDDIITNKVGIKSNLKKTSITISSCLNNENENLSKKDINVCGHTKKRKVQWADVYGGKLVELREFEASDDDNDDDDESDDEYEGGTVKACVCRIM